MVIASENFKSLDVNPYSQVPTTTFFFSFLSFSFIFFTFSFLTPSAVRPPNGQSRNGPASGLPPFPFRPYMSYFIPLVKQ
jgi:hypothetical protein